MRGLLNGADVFDTPEGAVSPAEVAEDGRSLTLALACDGVPVWETALEGVGSDPLSLAAEVAHLDLRAAVLEGGVLHVREYDVLDPELPIVERAIDFRP